MTFAACVTYGEAHTARLGSALGALAAAGDVYLLSGDLGAGKTCFIRGVASGLGVAEYAFSPSFVLIREYRGRLTLFHMDFYRLEDPAEIADLGVEDYFNRDGVCAIEWAERATGLLPGQHMAIELEYVPGAVDSRTIRLTAAGTRHRTLLQQLVNATSDSTTWN